MISRERAVWAGTWAGVRPAAWADALCRVIA
jgi:hypothetical protein